MSRRPEEERFFIDGPAGRIEALLETPHGGMSRGAAVVCHPHPQHGGTLHNKVTHTLARAFLARGFAALRFNFRGVGESEGLFDGGQGEQLDALAAARLMRQRHGGKEFWLAGFSFGAAIAIRTATECQVDGLVSVAPAVSRLGTQPEIVQPECRWLIVHGDQDELVDVSATIAWVNELAPGPELMIFEGTGHYFHGKLVELRKAVESFVDPEHAA